MTDLHGVCDDRFAELAARLSENLGTGEELGASVAVLVDAFRSEPGFASLRFGDVIDLRPAEGSPAYSVLVETLVEALTARFGIAAHKDLPVAMESAIVALDALAARAFARDAGGSAAFLGQGPKISSQLLGEYLSAR